MKTAFQKKAYSILTALVLLLTACTGAVFSNSQAVALEQNIWLSPRGVISIRAISLLEMKSS